ncbi:hypothetical protein Hanom_Chr01g00068611 [Helianthus anomalus]
MLAKKLLKNHNDPRLLSQAKTQKTRKRSTTVKNHLPLSDGKLTLRLALKHMGELVESLNENQ